MRLMILLAIAVVLLVAGVLNNISTSQQLKRSAHQQTEDPTLLRTRLKKAKPNENNEVIFPAPQPYLEEIGSLDEAMANYSIVVAKPIEAISIQTDPRNIMTYYKFRVLESLSEKHFRKTAVPENLPSGLSSLKNDEIYVLEGGGSVIIDGVKVTQKGEYEYSPSERYLLFISKNSSQTLAIVSAGKYGIFRVKPNDSLESIVEGSTPLKRDLSERHAEDLKQLRAKLNNRN